MASPSSVGDFVGCGPNNGPIRLQRTDEFQHTERRAVPNSNIVLNCSSLWGKGASDDILVNLLVETRSFLCFEE